MVKALHNLENATEAMEMDVGNNKRRRHYGESSEKSEGQRERSSKLAGKWPPKKDEFQPTYIPEQY